MGTPSDVAVQLKAIVKVSSGKEYGRTLQEVYKATSFAPLWIRNGLPTSPALAVITALENSQQKGLKSEDYDASRLPLLLKSLRDEPSKADAIAQFDAALTLSATRYVSDLRVGRANPTPRVFNIAYGQMQYGLAQFISQKLAPSTDVPSLLNEVEPSYSAYKRTEAALQTYLALVAQGQNRPLPNMQATVSAGEAYPEAALLAQRLSQLRDLPSGINLSVDDGMYSGALVDGVRHFQARHGLTADGKLDRETLAMLNTPLSDRVTQLEDALERWRWLPSDYPRLPVAVNIPEFVLRVFSEDHRIALRSDVVVGKAFGHQTPIFAKEMKYIIFRPFWNVPLSITRSEIVPHVQRSTSYFARERLQVTDQEGHVLSSGPVTADMLAKMRRGTLLVRQRPGPKNSLGLVKFIFPNENNVYLHSTPKPQLFSHARRDFSHGCIRVEKPAELAAWLLQDQPRWTLHAVNEAMQSGKDNQQVNLTQPVPVVIVYMTAVVEEDGEIYFFNDIYGQDRALNALLAKGPPYH
jgi:L,D-transpeptidase YcbB